MPGHFVDRRVSRDNMSTLRPEGRRLIRWNIDESLTEDELIALARRYPGSSQLLDYIAAHPNVHARGLRAIVAIALERDDVPLLNGVVTLGKAPLDVLRKLRQHASASVREHVGRNLASRRRSPSKKAKRVGRVTRREG